MVLWGIPFRSWKEAARWLLVDDPAPLETVYPTLRALLLRSVGVPEAQIAAGPVLPIQ